MIQTVETGGNRTKRIGIRRILFELAGIQLCRIGLETAAFSVAERTVLADTLFNMGFMAAAAIGLLLSAERCGFGPDLLPKRFTWKFILSAVVAAALFASAVFFTAGEGTEALLGLVYHALVTPMFEEILFRGLVWKQLGADAGRFGWILNAALFGLWHLGYADVVAWRIFLFHPEADRAQVLFWKAVTGFCIGAALALLRKKSGSTFLPFLLHVAINAVGS